MLWFYLSFSALLSTIIVNLTQILLLQISKGCWAAAKVVGCGSKRREFDSLEVQPLLQTLWVDLFHPERGGKCDSITGRRSHHHLCDDAGAGGDTGNTHSFNNLFISAWVFISSFFSFFSQGPVTSEEDFLHSNSLEEILSTAAAAAASQGTETSDLAFDQSESHTQLQEHQYSLPPPEQDPTVVQTVKLYKKRQPVIESCFVAYNQIARLICAHFFSPRGLNHFHK